MIPLRLTATEIDLHKDTISNDRCVVPLRKENRVATRLLQ